MVRPRRVAPASSALLTLVLAALVAAPASRAAGWSRPFRFYGPLSGDVVAPQLAVSPSGQAAVAFAVQDEEQPWVSQAMVAVRSASGSFTRLRVPSAKEVLDASFVGGSLELLTGGGPGGQTCCSAVQALTLQGAAVRSRQTLLTGLTGATVGRLVTLPRTGILAALATDRAVWAGQWQLGSRARSLRRLSASSSWPQALGAAGLAGGRDVVLWSGAGGLTEAASSVVVATGTAKRSPRRPRIVATVPQGHIVDAVAVAPSRGGATAAWIESWVDPAGAYQSQVVAVDLSGVLHPQTFQVPGEIVGGLTLSGDAGGDQVLTVRACDPLAFCSVLAFGRSARGSFGQAQVLGTIDASQEPAAAISGRGAAVVGWIDQGQIFASGRRFASARFSAPQAMAGTADAADLTLAFGSRGPAIAAWDQGTLAPSVVGASYAP